MNVFSGELKSTCFWNLTGSFGRLSAAVQRQGGAICAANESISVVSHICEGKHGVCVRTGSVKNVSDRPITLHTLSSKFILDGGEYAVYTQYSGWLNESLGQWQDLVSSIAARNTGLRNTQSAAPFMALWNQQVNRGVVFHCNAYCAWEMQVSRICTGGEAAYIEVEIGVQKDGLCLTLAPGEEVQLPEILYYDVLNKTDMDCWRLHSYINETMPRREMPVIYNSWLYRFDRFTYEDILAQVEKAAALGVEYFVIDAGWFGDGEKWWWARGDWEENQSFGFKGRMKEIAYAVREKGMKFGFWLEPEVALNNTRAVAAHPEYYIKNDAKPVWLLDFSNEEALAFIFQKTCQLIDAYGAEFIKFDFNTDLTFDPSLSGFTAYYQGHTRYIQMLRERYPALYLENCASGGTRMSLRDGKFYDSFWLSDDQSPYHSLRILKDTLLRMPPQWIECWASIRSVKDLSPRYGESAYADKILSTNDATWNDVTGVHMSFLQGLLTGGPIGLSFDLTAITEEVFEQLQDFIARFKAKRDFWRAAVCHILTDTPSMLVLEFRNEDFSCIELVVFAKKAMQSNLCVYPILDTKQTYRLHPDTVRSGADMDKNGIDFPIHENYTARFLSLEKQE